jgi:hypothetical protein
MQASPLPLARRAAGLLAAALVAACGGGAAPTPGNGATGASGLPGSSAPAGLSGVVAKGFVAGATVCAHTLLPSGPGNPLGCTTSDSSGAWGLGVDHAGPIVLRATGGTYVDEATGLVTALSVPLHAVHSAVRATTTHATVSALTHFAYASALGSGLGTATFAGSAAHVGALFGLPADALTGSVPTISPAGDDAHGAALRAVSHAMRLGATLDGVAASIHNARTTDGLRQAAWCTAGADGHLLDWSVLLEAKVQNDPTGPRDAVTFDVQQPSALWRQQLSGPTHAHCTVATNTAERVVLVCPPTLTTTVPGNHPFSFQSPNSYGHVSIVAAASASAYAGPLGLLPGDLQVVGQRVKVSGGPLLVAYNRQLRVLASGGAVQFGQAPSTQQSAAVTALRRITGDVASACALGPTGAPAAGGSTGGGSVVVGGGGGVVVGTLQPSGGLVPHPGVIVLGGGSAP